MKKTLYLLVLFISVMVLLVRFGGIGIRNFFGSYDKSGINVLSVPEGAQVFLDNKEIGSTPLEDKELASGKYLLRLQKENMRWEGKINLVPGTISVVNRELAPDTASSSGEILTLEKGKGITVISNPANADIEIDGKNAGKTPVTVNTQTGEHTINISHSNYLPRSIRAKLPENYNLTISADLALSEADLSAIATPVINKTPELVVKDTPTGFLRVRDKASLNGSEIAKVKPGDSLILLEESGSWYRIRTPDSVEGFVSAAYVTDKDDPQAPR